jgi:Phosphoglyceromutase
MFRIEKPCKGKPCALVIFDGFGYRTEEKGNAIAHANMTTWKWLWDHYPHGLLQASGRAVGLPDGFMGNSEVGHLCIGAGRVIPTALCKFHDCINDGSFFKLPWLIKSLRF